MYDLIAWMYEVGMAVFISGCLVWFLGVFLERRMADSLKNIACLMLAYLGGTKVLELAFPSGAESITTVFRILPLTALVFLLGLLFYRPIPGLMLFLAVTFVSLKEICTILAMTVSQWTGGIFDVLVYRLETGQIASTQEFEWWLLMTAGLLQMVMYGIFVLLFLFSLKSIVRHFRGRKHPIGRKELAFLLVPGLTGLACCMMLRVIMITVKDNVPRMIYEEFPSLRLLIPGMLALSLLSILFCVKLFQDMVSLQQERSSRMILERQIVGLQEHMAEIERIYSGVRSMKHDMKNTVAVMLRLLPESAGNEELQSYVSELSRTMDKLEHTFQTGSDVVDILLNMKYHEAAQRIAEFTLDAEDLLFPGELKIRGYDLGVILGNALDNAIEACEKLQKKRPKEAVFLRLSSRHKGKMLLVEAENSFDGELAADKATGLPLTLKGDKKAHGIGLSNIRKTAGKYHGTIDIATKRGETGQAVFVLTVMLQNEAPEELPENEIYRLQALK